MAQPGLLELTNRSTVGPLRTCPGTTALIIIYLVLAFCTSGILAQSSSSSYVEPIGDNVCQRVTSIRNVQRIPMQGVQTKRFRYMTKCSAFGMMMCSRYRLVYVNAFRELVSTQYSVRPGCCQGYVQDGTMCFEAPPTTGPPMLTRPSTLIPRTRAAPFSGLGARGSSGSKLDGRSGPRGHGEVDVIDQEGGFFEVNPDYKGPAVDKMLPLVASGVAGVITLTAVVAIILIAINRRKRRRNKIQPGFHDSVRFRSKKPPNGSGKMEMKPITAEKVAIQTVAKKGSLNAVKKSIRVSRKDGPYVEIADIPGTQFSRVTSQTETTMKDEATKSPTQANNGHHRRSLSESLRGKKIRAKRGGSMKCIPQYAVVNKVRKPDTDCENLIDKKENQKNNNDSTSSGELHGAYHAFTIEDHVTTDDTAPLYADPNLKAAAKGKLKSSTWNNRIGSSLRRTPAALAGNMLAQLQQGNLREASKIFGSSGGGGGRRLSSGYSNKDEESIENSSGYSSLRHSIEGEPDNQYGKLNHVASVVKPQQISNDTKRHSGSFESSYETGYDRLRRGPKSRTTGPKWATSGQYDTLGVNES